MGTCLHGRDQEDGLLIGGEANTILFAIDDREHQRIDLVMAASMRRLSCRVCMLVLTI